MDTISQRLAFEGIPDIIKQLQGMGAAGETSIKQIQGAVQGAQSTIAQASGGFAGLANQVRQSARAASEAADAHSKLGTAGTEAGHGVGELGKSLHGLEAEHTAREISLLFRGLDVLNSQSIEVGQSLLKLTGAFTSLGGAAGIAAAALLAFSKQAADTTRNIVNEATNLGISTERFETYIAAGKRVGLSEEEVGRQLEKLSEKFGEFAKIQAKEVENYQKSANEADKHRNELAKLATAADSARLAIQRNATAYNEAVIAGRGEVDSINKQKESLREADQVRRKGFATLEDQRRFTEKVSLENNKLAESQSRLDINYGKLSQLSQQQKIDQDKLRQNLEDIRIKENAVEKASADAGNVFKRLGIESIDPTTGKIKDLNLVLDQLITAFAKLESPQEKAAAAFELIGRRFAPFISLMRESSKGISELQEELEKSGALLKEDEIKFGAAFTEAFARLQTIFDGLSTAVGNIVGQIFVPAFKALEEGFSHNAQNIRDFAATFVSVLKPAIETAIKGISFILESIGDVAHQVAEAINGIFGTEVKSSIVIFTALMLQLATRFSLVVLAIAAVNTAINKLFGTDVPIADSIGTALAIVIGVKLVQAFVDFSSVIVRVVSGLRLLAIAFASVSAASLPMTVLVLAITAIGVALLALFGPTREISDLIRKVFGDEAAATFDRWIENFRKAKNDFIDTFTGMIQGVKDIFVNGFELMIDSVKTLFLGFFKLVEEGFNKIFGKAQQAKSLGGPDTTYNPYIPATAEGLSGGGQVRGSGIGDSVPARLEPGEFVVRTSAVRQLGTAFMHAINNGIVPRFAMGGIVERLASVVPSPLQVSAGGLPAASASDDTRVMHLTIGDRTFRNLRVPQDTADEMLQVARSSSMLRAGKLPGWHSSG